MVPTQAAEAGDGGRIGPYPSIIQVAKSYIFEQKLQECRATTGVSETKEDNIRIQGVAWIDNVRKSLRLPVRTFNTAVVYYHRFRLCHSDSEYGYIDAAAAALFTACKIEDTLKRSKEILCAAYNMKLPTADQLSLDDPLFENHSKAIVGLERLMLEASAFDYRNRYPQKLLIKLAKYHQVDRETVGKTAYNMSLDLYRTFAPLKQTTPTMALACVELAGRLHHQHIEELEAGTSLEKWRTSRIEVMETLLDLLDLYTHHRGSTIVGQDRALESFIAIRITLNQEASASKLPRYTNSSLKNPTTNGVKTLNGTFDSPSTISPVSPQDPPVTTNGKHSSDPSSAAAHGPKSRAGMAQGTVRFMLDGQRAEDEKKIIEEYFKVEEEEYEIEVEQRRRG